MRRERSGPRGLKRRQSGREPKEGTGCAECAKRHLNVIQSYFGCELVLDREVLTGEPKNVNPSNLLDEAMKALLPLEARGSFPCGLNPDGSLSKDGFIPGVEHLNANFVDLRWPDKGEPASRFTLASAVWV